MQNINRHILRHIVFWSLVIIGLLTIKSTYKVDDQYLLAGTKYETPIYYLNGKKDNKVLIIAGIHGNEIAGIHATSKIIEEKYDWSNLIIIPKANIESIKLGVRNPYYMTDLNRAFPGKEKGTDSEVLAKTIYDYVKKSKPDFVIDLHEWEKEFDEDSSFYSSGLIVNTNDMEFFKTVEKVYNDYISMDNEKKIMLDVNPPVGSFNKAISEGLNIPVLTIESNMNYDLDDRIDLHLHIIKSLIKYYGMDD